MSEKCQLSTWFTLNQQKIKIKMKHLCPETSRIYSHSYSESDNKKFFFWSDLSIEASSINEYFEIEYILMAPSHMHYARVRVCECVCDIFMASRKNIELLSFAVGKEFHVHVTNLFIYAQN